MQKTALAERILKSAAQGERDRNRLRDAALTCRLVPPHVRFEGWSQPVDATLYLKRKRWSVW